MLAELILILLWGRLMFWTCMAVRFLRPTQREIWPDAEVSRISVVIPAWNEEDQIGQTLASVFGQTLAPVQVIVVDDGSTDATARIVEDRMAGRTEGRLLRRPYNEGKAAALNTGIAHATGDLVLTLDADTRLAPDALAEACQCLAATGGDACALSLAVETPGALLERLQAQEYGASLTFERAGQAELSAISVMPGAATIFRRGILGPGPFSSRTDTEDADKTLELLASGADLVLEPRARAWTSAPVNLDGLLRQRARWTAGHLQCAVLHAMPGRARGWNATVGRLNFTLTTFAPVLAMLALVLVALNGKTPMLGLDATRAMVVMILLAYAQRGVAQVFADRNWPGLVIFLMEPPVLGVVHLAGFGLGLIRLARRPRR